LCSPTPLIADGTCISEPCWNHVDGIDSTQSIILDLYNSSAANLSFHSINFHPYNLGYNATTVICDPRVFTNDELDDLGFECHNGPYIATA
jgi:hypothetical protein